jgi:hypothetical protein
MKKIITLSNDSKQVFKFAIDGYEAVEITLEFKPSQNAWYYSILWGTFQVKNGRLVTGLNLLRQYRNIIPFGILVYHPENIDPMTIDDWTLNGYEFYMLDETDIAAVEDYYVK